MNSEQTHTSERRHLLRQAALLVVAALLGVYFTIPLLTAVKAALNPEQFLSAVTEAQREQAGLRDKLDRTEAKALMGGGDSGAEEKLKREIENLKRQLAVTEEKNKGLNDQLALVNTMLDVLKTKPGAPAKEGNDQDGMMSATNRIADLLAKILGCIGSFYAGTMFIMGWLRKRTNASPESTSTAT
ncbi:MAG: hypothetical protein HY913_12775 [Desulfomonile tiedjei]|nr:hypothetical protein [Desulfomonile tiedjei]